MDSPSSGVPPELMQRMHDANARLHDARLEVERAMDGSDYRHQQRVNAAEDQLQLVEKELEQIDAAIKSTLQGQTPAAGS